VGKIYLEVKLPCDKKWIVRTLLYLHYYSHTYQINRLNEQNIYLICNYLTMWEMSANKRDMKELLRKSLTWDWESTALFTFGLCVLEGFIQTLVARSDTLMSHHIISNHRWSKYVDPQNQTTNRRQGCCKGNEGYNVWSEPTEGLLWHKSQKC